MQKLRIFASSHLVKYRGGLILRFLDNNFYTLCIAQYPVTQYNCMRNMPIAKKINKNFFKKWSREMAYVLGFFAADGYITTSKNGGQFWCLHINDKDLLEKIRATIGSEHKISLRTKKGIKNISYRLQIGSIEMCNDLRKLGFLERKTKNLAVPNVPQKFLAPFVRGYFDGDGHVWVGYVNKGRSVKSWTIQTGFTSASRDFLQVLKDRLSQVGIIGGFLKKGKGDFYRLNYSVYSSLNLHDFMYNHRDSMDSGLFLYRKKAIFDRFIKMRS